MIRRVQRAVFELKFVPLSDEWARTVAEEKFGAELIASVPVFRNGPRKGKPKGYLSFIKCSVGGWGYVPWVSGGCVIMPGTHDWRLSMATPYGDPKEHSLIARWGPESGACMLQSPEQALKMFKTYGDSPRYG